MQFSHCWNVYYRWCILKHQGEVQGETISCKPLAPEQGQTVLKAMAFKTLGFVQYALL